MKINLVVKKPADLEKGFLAIPVYEGEKPELTSQALGDFLNDHPKFGKPYESQLIYTPNLKILLVGAGKKEKLAFEVVQNIAGTAVKCLAEKTKDFSLSLPLTEKLTGDQLIYAVTLGMELALYDPAQKYKTDKQKIILDSVQILVDKSTREGTDNLKKAMIVSQAVNLARNLGDLPGNEMTPSFFLKTAKGLAKENKLKITVIDEKKAKLKGLGAFVGVASGSSEPSYIVVLEYLGSPRHKDKWGIVGKGVTFDSGGISLKPGAGMSEMKYDMSGAASALAVITAAAKLKLAVNIVSVCVLTENLPGGTALKPGDILKSYCGKSIEVLNTDAEGRLILLDGLALAQKDFKVNKLIDLATLTGAMIVALGDYYTGVFTNNDEFAGELIKAGQKVGERYWLMPMDELFDEMIKSDFADITNLGHGGSSPTAAGSITGAKFLQQAIEKDHPWIHLDIAGTAWDLKSKPFRSAGATGVGVKTLVELLMSS